MAEKKEKEKKETIEELQLKIKKLKEAETKRAAQKAKSDEIKAKVAAAQRRRSMALAHSLVCDTQEVVKSMAVLAERIRLRGLDACDDEGAELFKAILAYGRK